MKEETRDQEAAEYYRSRDFLEEVREWIRRDIVGQGMTASTFKPSRALKKRDMPCLNEACRILKTEFPQLNHMRMSNSTGGWIIVDTKENTLFRRIFSGPSPFASWF